MKMDKGFFEYIGKQLKQARERKQWSLQDLSDRIGGHKSKQTLMRYEHGDIRMDEQTFKIICNALDLDPDLVVKSAKGNVPAIFIPDGRPSRDTDRHLPPEDLSDRSYTTIWKYLNSGDFEKNMIDRFVDDLYKRAEMYKKKGAE